MAVYKIVVPQGGYDGTNPTSSEDIVLDRGAARTVTQRVLTAQFGDGYSQRVKAGINPTDESFNVKFGNRSRASVNKLAAFFDRQSGSKFNLVITEHNESDNTIKVVCDQYNITYVNSEIHTITATLKRVFEP